jgi:hypothetical protein
LERCNEPGVGNEVWMEAQKDAFSSVDDELYPVLLRLIYRPFNFTTSKAVMKS